MSDEMKLGLVQLGAIERELEKTLQKAGELVAEASKQEADLVILPEFFSREYFPQYRDLSYLDYAEEEAYGLSFAALHEWAENLSVPIIGGIYERVAPGVFYNSAGLRGRDRGDRWQYRKTHPAAVRSLDAAFNGVDPLEMKM